MSKRSYRRLAVVAGAALAVGSMAPALAAQVNVDGDSAATIDVSGAGVPEVDSLVPASLITDVSDLAFGTVEDTQGMVLADVAGLQDEVSSIVGDLLGAASAISVDADANANASGGNVTVDASGVAGGTSDVLGLVPAPGDAVDGALDLATPYVDTALGLTDTAVALATGAPDLAFGVVDTGLGLLDGSVSGDVNVLASLLASF